MAHSNIIIVGAGAAGIAAASKLVSNNVTNIKILEATDHVGGRILTTKLDEGVVELGAQWVHGQRGNVVYSLGRSAGLITDKSVDLYKSQTIFSDGSSFNKFTLSSLCMEIMHDEKKLSNVDGSLGDYVNKRFRERLREEKIFIDEEMVKTYLNWFQKFQNSIDGSDSWHETSARGTLQYQECEGYSLTRWKEGGYVNILDLLMGKFKELIQSKIEFNKSVKTICWGRTPVELLCTDGQTFLADHVLVTVPLGVLKENVTTLFEPPLPKQKLLAIKELGFGTVAKIFLKFPHRWWPADSTGFNFMWKENDCLPKGSSSWASDVFGFYSVDSQPLVLCGWLVGEAARHMEQCSDTEVMNTCHQLLLKYLGDHYQIPGPQLVLRSQWYSNPHSRGVYSFRSVSSERLGVSASDLAEPLLLPSGHPVVLFGGEATHDYYYSTVHGAIETGWREADRLLASSPKRLLKASL